MLTPGFYLNCHDREENPLFESHDPSMMWDPISRLYYSYSTDTAISSKYQQGIPIRKSNDLVHFTFSGYALSEKAILEARNNAPYPPTRGFWAPYCHYYNGEYRLYYSATRAFGSWESRIWLAISDSPDGPFENRGVVMDTWFTNNRHPNAIDPHIIEDTTHRLWLVYGSFFGGIFIKELNPQSGLPLSGNTKELGTRLAKCPKHAHVEGPEGAAISYHDGYYYLFLSYGWLGEDYDIRVGRARQVTGPYKDFHGKSLDGASLGMKLAGSYQFDAAHPHAKDNSESHSDNHWTFGGFRAPGHGVPFYDPIRREDFFVHHIRDGAPSLRHLPRRKHEKLSYIMHYMAVRRMIFVDGWPVFSPEFFAGENLIQKPRAIASLKNWEWVRFADRSNALVKSQHQSLPDDLKNFVIFSGYDFENSCECICLSGYAANGDAIWGKFPTASVQS